jgi:hypothetical protein
MWLNKLSTLCPVSWTPPATTTSDDSIALLNRSYWFVLNRSYWFVDDVVLDKARTTGSLFVRVRTLDPATWRTAAAADQPWEQGDGCYITGGSINEIRATLSTAVPVTIAVEQL